MTTSAPAGIGANFVTNPEAFDSIILNGVVSPGICSLKHTKKHDWDKKKSKGSSGGTLSFTGSNVVKFDVRYHLWLPEHFDAWPGWSAMQRKSLSVPAPGAPTGNIRQASASPTIIIAQAPTLQPVAMSVYYPTLDEIGVRSCIVEEEGGLEPDGKGGAYYTWKYAAYNPSQNAGGTVAASTTGAGGDAPNKFAEIPQPTAAEKRLADLLNRAAGLTR